MKVICELRFLGGQNEDYSLGDSISDSSENLHQRGRGKVTIIYDFSEGGYVHKHISEEARVDPTGTPIIQGREEILSSTLLDIYFTVN